MQTRMAIAVEAWDRCKPLGWTLPALAVIVGLALFCPAVEQYGFRLPSARIVSAVLHLPCAESAEGYVIDHPRLAIRVAPACSGTTFFVLALLTLFWVWASGATGRAPALRALSAMLAGAYALTLTANVSRIVLCWGVARVAHSALPERWHGPIHLAAGFVVLTFFLIVAYAATAWLAGHAKTGGEP